MGTVFADMSSWTALTGHLGMKTAIKAIYIYKSKYVRIYIMMILILTLHYSIMHTNTTALNPNFVPFYFVLHFF